MGMKLIVRWSFIIAITFASSGLTTAGEEAEVEKGLVLWLRFEEGKGDIARDSSGHGNDGKIYGASWAEGKVGGGLQFDGIDDYVDCGSDEILVPKDDFTLEAWIYMNNMPLVEEGSFVQNPVLFKNSVSNYMLMVMYHQRSLLLHVGGIHQFLVTESLPMERWIHIAATVYDGYIATVYANGEIAGQNSGELIFSAAKKPVLIGRRVSEGSGHSSSFDGIIDEVRIYNRALSAEEMKAHYNAGKE